MAESRMIVNRLMLGLFLLLLVPDFASTDSVCATVRVRIEQEAILTRQVFQPSLEIVNEDATSAIDSVSMTLTVSRDILGEDVVQTSDESGGDLFTIVNPGAFPGVPVESLAEYKWTMVPKDAAAPTESVRYWVAGSLSYEQGGVVHEIRLNPDSMEVLPNPNLKVRYYHENFVQADSPFTQEREPSIPYTLGIIVKNTGAGTVNDFGIESGQPQIIENELGLRIGFEMISCQLGGEPLPNPTFNVEFGDISANVGKTALWHLPTRQSISLRCGVQLLIADLYHIAMPIRTVGEYLKRWGFTPQKPIRRAYERYPKAVRK